MNFHTDLEKDSRPDVAQSASLSADSKNYYSTVNNLLLSRNQLEDFVNSLTGYQKIIISKMLDRVYLQVVNRAIEEIEDFEIKKYIQNTFEKKKLPGKALRRLMRHYESIAGYYRPSWNNFSDRIAFNNPVRIVKKNLRNYLQGNGELIEIAELRKELDKKQDDLSFSFLIKIKSFIDDLVKEKEKIATIPDPYKVSRLLSEKQKIDLSKLEGVYIQLLALVYITGKYYTKEGEACLTVETNFNPRTSNILEPEFEDCSALIRNLNDCSGKDGFIELCDDVVESAMIVHSLMNMEFKLNIENIARMIIRIQEVEAQAMPILRLGKDSESNFISFRYYKEDKHKEVAFSDYSFYILEVYAEIHRERQLKKYKTKFQKGLAFESRSGRD